MTKEHELRASEGFPLTERERLFDRLSDKRLQKILFDEKTTIHEVKVDSNSFGEFLFIMASHPKAQGREVLTFWGLGFHEYRERWYIEEWAFHQSQANSPRMQKTLSHEEVKRLIDERKAEIQEDVDKQAPQSSIGALFEILADLTDEDGALSELDDLGFFFGAED